MLAEIDAATSRSARNSGSVDDAAEDVAAELVRAEAMRGARRPQPDDRIDARDRAARSQGAKTAAKRISSRMQPPIHAARLCEERAQRRTAASRGRGLEWRAAAGSRW